MKAFALLSGLFLLADSAYGQVHYTNDFVKMEALVAILAGTEHRTNNVTQAEAIRVTSRLKLGIWEEDASKILSNSDLKNPIGIGTTTGWDRCYGLADGTCLHLDYRPREVPKDGNWGGNGELQRAFIHSNEITTVFITLTKEP